MLPGNAMPWDQRARILVEEMILESRPIPAGRGNPGKKKKMQRAYHDVLSAFDIETTNMDDLEQSFMFLWQWHFRSLSSGEMITVYGRMWEEWYDCCDTICGVIPPDHAIVVLDHNLSFEFQFIREYVAFQPEDIFAIDNREILKCTVFNKLEFRCTQHHSNTSLKVYLDKWKVEHRKLSGDEFDYNKIRYPWTELTEEELRYGLHDVIGLVEAYIAEMEYWHDTLYTVPMTSTGYVRRICKKAWSRINFHDRISWMPDLQTLEALHEAFRGGDTHASRFHSTPEGYKTIISEDVQSWDRASSYPDVLVNCRFPLGNWYRLRNDSEWVKQEEIEKYVHVYDKAVLMRAHFRGLRLRDPGWTMPYLPKSKAGFFDNIAEDNGRILSADLLSTTITDVDWEIIKQEYSWEEVYFSDVYYCRYRYLPDFFRNVVREFFRQKTQLKGAPEGSLEEVQYKLSKELINALYGMSAQWPLKESVYYVDGEWWDEEKYLRKQKEDELGRPMTEKEAREMMRAHRAEQLRKHNKKAFLPYSIGVWTTALARLELHRGLWEVSAQWTPENPTRALYVDTDSIKFVGNVDMTRLNEFYQQRSEANRGCAANAAGKVYYLGVFDHEYTARQFATMGAKKYVVQLEPDPDGKTFSQTTGLYITIAGVTKTLGAEELYQSGGIEAFHDGMKFERGGGVRGVYNDRGAGVREIDGHNLYIGSNLYLGADTYTLGLSDEYARLLESLIMRDGKVDGKTLGGAQFEQQTIL